jgi:hypothetical protein
VTPFEEDQQRVSAEDDELRHYLADATVLLDDAEVYVTPADEPGQMFWSRLGRRVPRAKRYTR